MTQARAESTAGGLGQAPFVAVFPFPPDFHVFSFYYGKNQIKEIQAEMYTNYCEVRAGKGERSELCCETEINES